MSIHVCCSSRREGRRDRTPVHSSKTYKILHKPLQMQPISPQHAARDMTLARSSWQPVRHKATELLGSRQSEPTSGSCSCWQIVQTRFPSCVADRCSTLYPSAAVSGVGGMLVAARDPCRFSWGGITSRPCRCVNATGKSLACGIRGKRIGCGSLDPALQICKVAFERLSTWLRHACTLRVSWQKCDVVHGQQTTSSSLRHIRTQPPKG